MSSNSFRALTIAQPFLCLLLPSRSPFAPWPEKSLSQKEKRKKKENPPPTPFLQKKKEKRKQESEKENRNPEYAQGCSFSFSQGR